MGDSNCTADYQRMYTLLFNAITDGLELLGKGQINRAQEILMQAQQKAEELYCEGTSSE